jgi:hypothetical protein
MTQQMLYFRKQYPQRTLLVKFEEFLSSPARSLNEIFRFVLDEALEEPVLSERLSHVAYGASNVPTEGGKGIRKEPMERWKKSLGESHVKMVDRLTGKTALRAGYETGSSEPLPGFGEILKAFPTMKHKAVILAKLTYLEAFEALV